MKNLYFILIAFLISFSSRAQILGTPSVCVGSTTSLSDPSATNWVSTNTAIATVGSSSGIVTGISAGVVTIYDSGPAAYTATVNVTVAASPTSVTGPSLVCSSSFATYSDSAAGGAWSVGFTAIATIDAAGLLVPVTTGTTTVVYTLPGGCSSSMVITIDPTPSLMTITPNPVCVGSTAILSDAASMGIWSSSNPAIASVGATGVLTGNTAGTTNITYALGTGCSTTSVVTVNGTPSAILGTPVVCIGGTTLLTDVAVGGVWSSTTPAIATIGGATGVVAGGFAGTATISYTIPTGCSATIIVTVNPAPGVLTSPGSICLGGSDTVTGFSPPGYWSGGATLDTTLGTGVITGTTIGISTLTYTSIGTTCSSTMIVTVASTVAAITGSLSFCQGYTTTLADATTGGSWTSGNPTIAAIGSSAGLATGLAPGTAAITYSISGGCLSSAVVTVNPIPFSISGSTLVCGTGTTLLTDATAGGTWSSSVPLVATIDPATGIVTGVAPGTATISYGLPTACAASIIVTVDALPTITAASATNCGGTFTLNGGGAGTGGTYLWSPSTGLSCAGCATSTATISSTTTYTVTGADAGGCTGTNTVTLNADRVSGYISLTATATDTLKVWLIQFNPSDSSLIAQDSTLSCMDSGTPYYEFDSKPAGSYMVKAKLLSAVPGTSGYVPTYGLSSNVWDSAATITHIVSATDTQHINMIYGTVPSGPGFIGGLISSGAGKGTSGGVPVVGMLVYLKNATTNAILTYTYTDGSGNYSFGGLANGSYTIYPVDYHYHTIPWIDVTLSASSDTAAGVGFYQHNTSGTITPYATPVPVCCGLLPETAIGLFPNPAGSDVNITWSNEPTGDVPVVISDLAGRKIYETVLNMSSHNGISNLDISSLNNGVYIITIKSNDINYTNKLVIQR